MCRFLHNCTVCFFLGPHYHNLFDEFYPLCAQEFAVLNDCLSCFCISMIIRPIVRHWNSWGYVLCSTGWNLHHQKLCKKTTDSWHYIQGITHNIIVIVHRDWSIACQPSFNWQIDSFWKPNKATSTEQKNQFPHLTLRTFNSCFK